MAPLGYAEAERPDGADLVILNTCHIREKAAEKVFSELGTIRRLKEAKRKHGGRMLIAVAGCVAQAEGAEILERAPVRRSGVRPAGLSPPAGDGGARVGRHAARAFSTPASRPSRNSISCPRGTTAAGSHRLPDGAGGLRQVLHLLRRAVHARRGVLPPGRRRDRRGEAPGRRPARARSRCSARTSTPITARRPMAARVGARRAGPRACRHPRAGSGCATRPPTRATSMTGWLRPIATCRS